MSPSDKTPEGIKVASTPHFPNEILELIVPSLSGDHSTLRAWCLASRTLYDVGWRLLWRHVNLIPLERSDKRQKEAMTERDEERLKVLREQTRILTVQGHLPCLCENPTGILQFPKLRTLNVYPGLLGGRQRSVQPFGFELPSFTLRSPAMIDIETLVFVVSPKRCVDELTPAFDVVDCCQGLDKVKRIVCIFDPSDSAPEQLWYKVTSKGEKVMFGPSRAQQGFGLGYLLINREGSSHAPSPPLPPLPITVVNIDSALTTPLGTPEATHKDLERYMVERIWSEPQFHYAEYDLQMIENAFNFISLEEYLSKEKWWDVFEPEEVERWIRDSRS
ncbi:hypothetical protein IAT40_004602 [Kwoniella sp. CBS 6097]